jgi:hypothetical protein
MSGSSQKLTATGDLWIMMYLPEDTDCQLSSSKNGSFIHMERSDWEYVAYITIDGYHTGYLITKGARGSANAQFYGLTIRNCHVF